MQRALLTTELSYPLVLQGCTTNSELGGLSRPQNAYPTGSACTIP